LHSWWRIAERLDHGNQTFLFISSDTLPSPVLLAAQRSRTGLSSLRHLWNSLRIRLGDHAPCSEAGRARSWSCAITEPDEMNGQERPLKDAKGRAATLLHQATSCDGTVETE